MIFVTVGTTPFEGLVKAADALDKKENVIIQKADGFYVPINHEFIEFTDQFASYLDRADIVVTHGGAGTLFDLVGRGMKVVGVANGERNDLHQEELLKVLEDAGHIIWCKDLNDLESCITAAKTFAPKKYQKPESKIAEDIIKTYSS